MQQTLRKIPFNYTSADDQQVIVHILGQDFYHTLSRLEEQKDTGRSSRLLHRFIGDMFVLERNPFLLQELIESTRQKQELFNIFRDDLAIIQKNARHEDVLHLIEGCETYLNQMDQRIQKAALQQKKIRQALGVIIGRDNIYFDPFNLTAHTTDATDWRLYPPVAVLRPDKASQVPDLIKAVHRLGLNIIPRGAGTGLTGGAVPLTPYCVMINTEKLNRISPIKVLGQPGEKGCAKIHVEAGVITQDIMDFASDQGWVFATDPTSAWACTIGGNIAENAGGKKAVFYGTALDNLISYEMVMPSGKSIRVKRQDHPLRKILPQDQVVFEICDDSDHVIERIELKGTDIRKPGLGKDVTNKALMGLPGIQKEGCDGIITGATFVLYPKFRHKKTFCIEFFGDDMAEASQVIADVVDSFSLTDPALMALEHFDEEYIKAIDYKTKTLVGSRLKAVLLVDMVSNDHTSLQQGIERIETILDGFEKTGLSVACDESESKRYWQDRKRLGAIASHTNAFKLNEDIVLPIRALADFARYVDQYNIMEKRYTQETIIKQIVQYLDQAIPMDDPQWLESKVSQAKDLAFTTLEKLEIASRDAVEAWIHPKNFFNQVMDSLRGYQMVSEQVKQIYERVKSRLIVIATHMHAGDGNVHVNIPVLSNDREMMARAAATADDVMAKAVEFNGVVSGEHGIGVTKAKHLDPLRLDELNTYRSEIDPKGLMNPEKLRDPGIMNRMFTPSFNLLKLEASILKHGALEDLASDIANCVRCGRCKPQCPVFFPAKNMFFHPRNKNLAVAALIEALLYIVQRTQSTGFKSLMSLEQIADHCTICHKCLLKCPVKIDSGEISVSEREILANRKFKHTPVTTKLALNYLSSRHRGLNRMVREGVFKPASLLQPLASKLFGRALPFETLKSPVSHLSRNNLYDILPHVADNQALVLEPAEAAEYTVMYFPGCGSERLFSDISKACIYGLLKHRTRVVLPPPFLCCGYPSKVNARTDEYQRLMLQNAIIFSQIRDMFSDLEFNACVVSCGTCMEALKNFNAQNIFSTRIEDVFAFLHRNTPAFSLDGNFYYHAPCHDSMNGKAIEMLRSGKTSESICHIPHCCSEAGTMSMSRPGISNAMLDRKSSLLSQLAGVNPDKKVIVTNCPSCIQGLGRLRSSGVSAMHMMVAWAQNLSGRHWEHEMKKMIRAYEVVNF